MCRTTTWVPIAKLGQLQELVKSHNLRFCGNPFVMRDRAMVTISSDHLPPGSGNAFWSDWYRVTTPIVEKVRRPSVFTRVRRILRCCFR